MPSPLPNRFADDPDGPLLEAIERGDPGAFRALFERHAAPALRLAQRVLAVRADAEDVVQEAFMSVHRKLASFRGEARFATWFHRLVVNRCLDLRNRRVLPSEELGARQVAELPAPEHSPGSAGVLGDDRARELLEREVAAMPLQQRLVFQLCAIEGRRPSQTALVLGLRPGTVRHHLFQARERLRERLEPLLFPMQEGREAIRTRVPDLK